MVMCRFFSDRWFILAGICMLGLVLAAGCSDTTSAGADAGGIVTLDGQPVAGALVSLIPSGSGSSAFGTTGPDGRFTVQTSASQTGLAAGEYTVIVEPGDSDEADAEQGGDNDADENTAGESVKKGIPAKYQNEKTSGITVSASEAGPNEFTIELTSGE